MSTTVSDCLFTSLFVVERRTPVAFATQRTDVDNGVDTDKEHHDDELSYARMKHAADSKDEK